MRKQVGHCSDLVRTAMSFLRQTPRECEPFNLNDVIALCLDVARPKTLRQNVAVVTDLDSDLPNCEGNIVMVRQAVLNLVYNAVQAMEDQEEPRQLRLQSYCDAGMVYGVVHDSGPGIPDDQQPYIFDALFTTKENSGTGLGLAVVRNVMDRHGGAVRLEDAQGRGARFVLAFPVSAHAKTAEPSLIG